MGWLSVNGTPFAYRMSMPVANPLASGDRQFSPAFPGPYLRAVGKIQQPSFADVHVTKADGTTELPCALYASNTGICIDFTSMPQGHTTIYVYYGHATATAPTLPSFVQGESGGLLVDSGFDWAAQGAVLSDAVWPASGNAPSTKIHDHTYPQGGQAWSMESKITAQAGALYSGVGESVTSVTGATAEIRFWVRFNETTTYKTFAGGTPQAFHIRFDVSGIVQIYTERAATGYAQNNYTAVGTYPAGAWWEYRLVFNFANGTYTLSRRALVTDGWTGLKAAGAPDYNIPMRATGSLTTMAGTVWLGYQGAIWWMDALKYSSAGISDTVTVWTAHVIPPNHEVVSEGDAGAVVYVFGADLEATHLDSANAAVYNGAATAHKVGITTGAAKYHFLIKHFEAGLPKGTVVSAKLHLYLESNANIGEATTLLAHRLKTTARSGGTLAEDWAYYVRTGWTLQASKSRPTWNTRFCSLWLNYPTGADIPWQTAGAMGGDEIDPAEHADLALAPGFAVGYKDLDIPATWINDWLGDGYCSGVLIKDSTDVAGANNRHTLITAQGQVNSPVLEVVYSALDTDTLVKRKLTTDTYNYSTFSVHNRYVILPSEYWMGMAGWVNNELKINVAYISPDGRIAMVQRDSAPAAGSLNGNSPGFGFYYDASENRMWFVGVNSGGYLCLAYCAVGVGGGAGSWTWKTHISVSAAKGTAFVANGVIHIVYYRSSTGALSYMKYARSTDTWATPIDLVNAAVGGTQRAIAASHAIASGDVMAGAGEIWADGSVADYPAWGGVKIDSEYFWYAAKDSGENKLTGVTRAMFGSANAAHSVGAVIAIDRSYLTYSSVSYDSIRNCLHVSYTVNSSSPVFAYLYSAYLRHTLSDADGVWKDEAGATLTLPVDQRTERQAGPAGVCCYCTGNHLNSDGDLLLANLRWAATGGEAGFGYSTPWIARLLHGGNSFSHVDTGLNMVECAFLDMGAGLLKMTGLNGADETLMVYTNSSDNGASWPGPVVTISTHVFPYYLLWCSSCAQTAFLNTNSMMYAQHFAEHGAIWLNALAVGPPPNQIILLAALQSEACGGIGLMGSVPIEQLAGRGFDAIMDIEARPETVLLIGVGLDIEALQGAVSRYYPVPMEWDGALQLNFIQNIPVDAEAVIGRMVDIPAEALAAAQFIGELPIEAFQRLSPTMAIPWERTGAIGVWSIKGIEIDARGGIGFRKDAPIESAGMIQLVVVKPLSVEAKARLQKDQPIAIEASGLLMAIVDSFNVLVKLVEPFLDEFDVVESRLVATFPDQFNVVVLHGNQFPDTFRVLAEEIVNLFDSDIQQPVGKAEIL